MAANFPDGITVGGRAQFNTSSMALPTSCVGESQINGIIGAEYLEHRNDATYSFDGTVTTGDTEQVKICHSAGFVKAVYVTLGTAPTSSHTVTVDVQKYASSAWSTVMTGVISFSSSDANEDIKTGTLTTTSGVTYVAGNKLRVITAGTNTTAADLFVLIVCWENGV